MIRNSFLFIFFTTYFGFIQAQNFGGHPGGIHWNQIDTRKSRLIFPAGLDSQASRISKVMHLLDTYQPGSLGNKMYKWNVLLLNQNIYSNAYVRLAPIISELYMLPDQNNFSSGSLRWDDNLIIHEHRHMQQFSNFNNGLTKVFSFLLGEEGQLLANGMTVPDYFFEGDAVWQETMVSNQGRGRMPSFFNGLRALWADSIQYSWMKMRSGSLVNYVPDHYELGYPLVAYGFNTYGNDFWRKVINDATRFKGLFYAFNHSVKKNSGVTYGAFHAAAFNHFKNSIKIRDEEAPEFITKTHKRNVTDYLFPQPLGGDTIIVTKQSYKEVNAFYFIVNGIEKKIRVKDYVLDDYFSYRNGKVVYASFTSDPRRLNRTYSVIKLLDIYTNKQQQLTFRSKYFSPDISPSGNEIIAVHVSEKGVSNLHRLNMNGTMKLEVPIKENYFITQTKYIHSNEVVAAVRHPDGRMALARIDIANGDTKCLTPFTYNVIGYPFVKGDTVYFSQMNTKGNQFSDQIFAIQISTGKTFQLTNNTTGLYQPMVSINGDLIASRFTAKGNRLQLVKPDKQLWNSYEYDTIVPSVQSMSGQVSVKARELLSSVDTNQLEVTKLKKTFGLFNFHSARPFAEANEWGYTIYGDNVLSTFSNQVSAKYNTSERSNTFGYDASYGGLYPFINIGASYAFNRNIDTAVGKGIQFNAAKCYAGISIPLSFLNGRTFKYLNVGYRYNIEQIPYIGIGKDVFSNKALKYSSAFFSFSNVSRQAKQHILPRFAQTISISYRQAYTFRDSRKWLASASLYFPGLFANHHFVLDAAIQKRDTLSDLFSNNFPYARGYQALSTRKMYKLGFNYHFPICYPDWGFGNIIFFQRLRANVFYDYNVARARLNGGLTNITNRSTGTEIYFDTKIWNALPVSFGFRYSKLLDTDLRNPLATGLWEFILPINLIPN